MAESKKNKKEEVRKDAVVMAPVLRLKHRSKQDKIEEKNGIRRIQHLQDGNNEGEHRSGK